MDAGESATHMGHGSQWRVWLHVAGTTKTVLLCAELVSFCCPSNSLMVGGVRATFPAKKRYVRTQLRIYLLFWHIYVIQD